MHAWFVLVLGGPSSEQSDQFLSKLHVFRLGVDISPWVENAVAVHSA